MNGMSNKFLLLKDIIHNGQSEETKDIYENLKRAKKEWDNAKNIFENVSNPDLVDYAIYNVDAAEKRYMYILNQIKNGNVQ
ncbi:MAG: DUF2508 family protein [Tissierellia bacterium]|nr:DUF2508 family protein [Tissierellia bacterium]MDD4781176.1 DUF2508 family protein [Tissierellia bacterium]